MSRLPALSRAMKKGLLISAAVPCPASPPKSATPVPATVVMVYVPGAWAWQTTARNTSAIGIRRDTFARFNGSLLLRMASAQAKGADDRRPVRTAGFLGLRPASSLERIRPRSQRRLGAAAAEQCGHVARIRQPAS